MLQKQQIILKHIDGMTNRAIARELHMSKDTVNKYINEYQQQKSELLQANPEMDPSELIQAIVEKPKYNSDGRKPTKVTPEIMDVIEELLELNRQKRAGGRPKQVLKKLDIHEELLNRGFNISYATVKRLVREIEDRHREAFIRQEYDYGDVCEFDWGEVNLNIGDEGFKKYQMAVFTAAKSNYRFAMLFKAQNTPAFQQSHAEFFEHCTGSFKTMVYDNMRVAVKKFIGLHEKEPTKALTELSVYYGFRFRFCNIVSGNEKGHVERSVEFVRRKAFKTKETFDSITDANRYLLESCMRINGNPITNGTVPLEVLDKEKEYLHPHLPMFESCVALEYRVDKYSTVLVSQNHYSVPDSLVGKMVLVKAYTDKIIAYHENSIVAVHTRSYLNHDWCIQLKHYLKTLYKKPGALHKSTALLQADTKIKNIFEHYYSKDAKTFLEVLNVIYEKGVDVVTDALRELERISPLDMSVEKVKSICDHAEETRCSTKKDYTDMLSEKSRTSLSLYNQLAGLQSEEQWKGAV
ncbi:IS21 family transposase [Clostridium sp. DJ247]|uniref:IS21 family transposase n=1 Tax=Clostridium sp. DJ247 TaxID=2726188 RepID=UPI00162A0855|nr:IS21 family transposase [Clostridium sp. DJ247]